MCQKYFGKLSLKFSAFFRILEDDAIPIERKKPFASLLSEVYLISDRESLRAISALAQAGCVDLITFSIVYDCLVIYVKFVNNELTILLMVIN